MEGFRELLGDEDGEVRIFTLLVGITVAVDREQAIVILFDDEAIGIHAERADPVVKGFAEIDELRFIDDVGNRFQDFCRHFYADADVDGIGRQFEAHLFDFMDKPFRPFPAGSTDQITAGIELVIDEDAFDFAFLFHDMVYSRIGHDVDFPFQEIAHVSQDLSVDVGPEMADTGRDETQVRCGSFALDVADAVFVFIAIDFTASTAEAAVDVIDVTNLVHEVGLGHVVVEVAAVFRRQRQFSVTEGTGTTPATDDIAHPVFGQGLLVQARRNALPYVLPLFDHENLKSFIGQFQGRKNTGRTSPDDNDIICLYCMHNHTSFYV